MRCVLEMVVDLLAYGSHANQFPAAGHVVRPSLGDRSVSRSLFDDRFVFPRLPLT
jgi:hypothetical protein